MTKFKSGTVKYWQVCGEMSTFTLFCIKVLKHSKIISLLSLYQPALLVPDNFRQIE